METIVMPQGFANAIVDFTSAFSPLLVGLLGVMALSVGMLVALALREHRAQISIPVAEPTSVADGEYREAA
jgi:hypothetical protein